MTIPDGAYADATFREDGTRAIGVVLVEDGIAIEWHGARIVVEKSSDAEVEAVQFAKAIYPLAKVFTDNAAVAAAQAQLASDTNTQMGTASALATALAARTTAYQAMLALVQGDSNG